MPFEHTDDKWKREYRIALAISDRQIWATVFNLGEWETWERDEYIFHFIDRMPRLPLDMLGTLIN